MLFSFNVKVVWVWSLEDEKLIKMREGETRDLRVRNLSKMVVGGSLGRKIIDGRGFVVGVVKEIYNVGY